MGLRSLLFGPRPGPLCDVDIQRARERGDIQIVPFDAVCVQPASYDLTLGPMVLVPAQHGQWGERDIAGGFSIYQRQFILASTAEIIQLGPSMQAQINGKSSVGRSGLQVECAGFIDPGFCGQLTLELVNLGPWPIPLRAGMPIAQLSFVRLARRAHWPYGHDRNRSHYQGQMGPTSSRIEERTRR